MILRASSAIQVMPFRSFPVLTSVTYDRLVGGREVFFLWLLQRVSSRYFTEALTRRSNLCLAHLQIARFEPPSGGWHTSSRESITVAGV